MKTVALALLMIAVFACVAPQATEEKTPLVSTPGFTMKTQEKTYEDCVAGTEGCTYVRLDYPVLTEVPAGAEPVAESSSEAIRDFVFRPLKERAEGEPPVKLVDEFIDDFSAFKEAEPRAASGVWYLERKAFVLSNTESVLSLSLCERTYTGGAHGNETFHFESFDGRTGAPLTLDDVVAPGKRSELEALAEAAFRERHELAPDADLAEAGFSFEEGRFALTENFAITAEGLVFYYNSYEVAPYAFGATEIELGWDELGGIVASRFAPATSAGT